MIKNKLFIDEVIKLRNEMKDTVQEIATRNKASPLNTWNEFQPYNAKELNLLYFTNIDGVKLKLKHTTLTVNGRHKNK